MKSDGITTGSGQSGRSVTVITPITSIISGAIAIPHSHKPAGQSAVTPCVVPVVVVVATEALIPAFPAMSSGSRLRSIPTVMVILVEYVDVSESESPMYLRVSQKICVMRGKMSCRTSPTAKVSHH